MSETPAIEKRECARLTMAAVCIESSLVDPKEGERHLVATNTRIDQVKQPFDQAACSPPERRPKLESSSTTTPIAVSLDRQSRMCFDTYSLRCRKG